MSDGDHEEVDLDLSDNTVVTKYKTAAEICNKVIKVVRDACKPGAKVVDVANTGDDMIEEECGKIFKGKQMNKGIAFPTCLSIDHCVGHYSPLAEDASELKEGQFVKIDLGVHIDGFIAVQATTVCVGKDAAEGDAAVVTGRPADALACAQACFDASLRLVRPGRRVSEVAGPLNKIAEAFDCTLVEGVMTHNMKQFVIDGNKCVLNRPSPDQKVEDDVFEENEVYAVDIVVSTGEGKAKVVDEKQTTVYKRALNMEYSLRMKASRAILSEINKRYPCMPFPLRKLLAAGSANKFGLVECLNHQLLHAYPVLWEKEGETVAHIKATVLLMPNGSDRVTTSPLQVHKSQKSIEDPELKALLTSSIKTKKKASKKKKAATQTGADEEVTDLETEA